MADIKLQGSDLSIENNDLVLLDGEQAIRQQIEIALRMFKGECFFAPQEGLPYYQQILIKNPNTSVIGAILKTAILSVPGVESVETLVLDFDGATRTLEVEFSAITTDGANLEFTEFIL